MSSLPEPFADLKNLVCIPKEELANLRECKRRLDAVCEHAVSSLLTNSDPVLLAIISGMPDEVISKIKADQRSV